MAEYKNIILVALRDFEFSHGLGHSRRFGRARTTSALPPGSRHVAEHRIRHAPAHHGQLAAGVRVANDGGLETRPASAASCLRSG
jgi:hypothetical protein